MGNSRNVFGWHIGGGFWCLSVVDAIRFITFWPHLFHKKWLVVVAVTEQTPDKSHYGFGFGGVGDKKSKALKWRHNGSLGGIKADMGFKTETKIAGAELWSSNHPRRMETMKIADDFVEKYKKDGRLKKMEDLWPMYGFHRVI